ncbi:ABC transporter substrate-binding protein [Kutzneria sp. NPDC052558]|uniref:ABC transporter substrate-binding protein n=1 Tax=Kutzneria sp. NPDC052558 TaxID=3364121 RepID=UPI0037C551D7
MSHHVLPRRALLRGAGGLGLAAVLAACATGTDSGSSSATGPAKPGGTLRVGTPAPPTAVDPVTMYDGSAIAIVQLVADYLIWLDSDFSLVPRLATKWSADDGNQRWAFTLRQGVTFSDGTPLDATAVKASFDRLLDPAKNSAALSAFKGVLAPGGVSVRDGDTVVFTLQRPFSDFPYLVSAGNYNAVILKADYAGDFTAKAIGTGPFLLTDYNPSTGATLTRNPRYWQPGRPYLDGVRVKFYADAQAEQLALQGGDIDALVITDPSVVQAAGDVVLDKVPATSMTTLTLRVDQHPFDRKEVRQAIAYALDRPAVNDAVDNGIAQLANDHLFAPLFPASPHDIPQRAKDPAKVRQLLAEAGVEHLSFPLSFDPPNKNYALVIQDQLKQVGIDVTLDQQTSQAFYGGDQAKDTPWLFTPANLVGWAGRPVPSQFVSPMVTSDGVWNGSKYRNPQLDAALLAYDGATTDQARAQQAKIIAAALHEDVPVVLTLWNGAVRAYDKAKFTGIKAHPSSFVDFSAVRQS